MLTVYICAPQSTAGFAILVQQIPPRYSKYACQSTKQKKIEPPGTSGIEGMHSAKKITKQNGLSPPISTLKTQRTLTQQQQLEITVLAAFLHSFRNRVLYIMHPEIQ